MIGIRFKLPNEWGNFLALILKNINNNYFWNITDEQIFLEDNKDLFTKDIYNNETFKELITNNKYYLIFGNIAAFKSNTIKEIRTYEDFQNSDCEILIVIVDSIFIDIFVKDKKLLTIFKENVETNNFTNIEFITSSKDKRTIFHI